MKIKFRSIELFGISGSGKTFLRKIIKKRLIREGYKVFDTREIIILYIGQFIETNLYEKILLSYFSFILRLDVKTTLWNSRLSKICEKYLLKNLKNYLFFKKKINEFFFKDNVMKFNYHYIWIKELIIANIIFNKLKKNNKKIIFFPDEGFGQKIFLLNYLKKINLDPVIKKYLKNKIFCEFIINIKTSKKKLIKINKIKRNKKFGWILKDEEIENMLLLEKKIKKSKYFKFKVLKNYKNIESQINQLIYK